MASFIAAADAAAEELLSISSS
eukprot:Gb_06488 [translate_table: standard]